MTNIKTGHSSSHLQQVALFSDAIGSHVSFEAVCLAIVCILEASEDDDTQLGS